MNLNPIINPIGARLRAARAFYNLKQSDVAERAGLARLTILKIENGRSNPEPKTIKAIEEALGVNLVDNAIDLAMGKSI